MGDSVGDVVGGIVHSLLSLVVALGLYIVPASRCGSIIAVLYKDTSTTVSQLRASTCTILCCSIILAKNAARERNDAFW